MLIFDVAYCEDRGSHWMVTNVQKNNLEQIQESGEVTLPLSFVAGHQIKTALLEGKAVFITKHLMTNEVHPGEYEIIDIDQFEEVEYARRAALIKIRTMITPVLTKYSGLTLYGFIVLNNDLANRGYFITNENREEKYLEILETGDEQLIQKLEDYLNYKDEIEKVSHIERRFSRFKERIKDMETREEINEAMEKWIQGFNSQL